MGCGSGRAIEQAAGYRQQATGSKLPAAGCRQQVAGSRLRAAGCRQQATGSGTTEQREQRAQSRVESSLDKSRLR